jgi:predicted HAD superfamily Cof-like phosphohydrolase
MTDIVKDSKDMAAYYGFDVQPTTDESLLLRLSLLDEELEETKRAFINEDPEEFVDGLIDLMVVAAITLQHCNVDVGKAWDAVQKANMSKVRGINPKRPNSNGFDIYKPEGWIGPSHAGNHGDLKKLWATNEYKEIK